MKKLEFSSNHDLIQGKENCQLFVAMTGDKEFIKTQLKMLLESCDDSYGKPRQGIISHYNGTIDIITPYWEGKNY